MKKFKICILGVTGFIGSQFKIQLLDKADVIGVSHRAGNDSDLIWNNKNPLPKEIINADIIINCARSNSGYDNLKTTKILLSRINNKSSYIHLSSNAIYARPNSFLSKFFFKGDSYIREKLKLMKLIKKKNFKNKFYCIEPTIVLGEGGSWSNTQDVWAEARSIKIPSDAYNNSVKTIKVEKLVDIIINCIYEDKLQTIHRKQLYDEIIPVKKLLLNKNIIITSNKNTFFSNNIKNFLLLILASKFIPDKAAIYLIDRIKNKNPKKTNNEDISIEGMTRLYLSTKN